MAGTLPLRCPLMMAGPLSLVRCKAAAPARAREAGSRRVSFGSPGISSLAHLVARRRSRSGLHIVAFRGNGEDTVVVPLDAFALLQVNKAASKDSCLKAYDKLVNITPEAGFSEDALYSRAVVLKAATDTLTDNATRRAYERQPELEIAYADLPGAMILLQEAGEADKVLAWGEAWLADSPRDPRARDVTVAMALAQCDLAATRLQADPSAGLECYDSMQGAVDLLKKHRVGQQLQIEIRNAMEEMALQVAMQEVALPLSTSRRALGVERLARLVWRQGPATHLPGTHMDRAQCLRAVRPSLTAAEQVQLFESASLGAGATSEERYDAALAYISLGLRTFTPAHIVTADKLLQALQDLQPGAAGQGELLDVTVERAVCKLMLGSPDDAEAALGLAHNSTVAADPAVREFVLAASGEELDLTPGLCALAEQWLTDVVLPSFRENDSSPASLNAWFGNQKVQLYLKVWGGAKQAVSDIASSVVSAVSRSASQALALVLAAFAAVWAALLALPRQAISAISGKGARGGALSGATASPTPKRPIRQKVALKSATAVAAAAQDTTRDLELDVADMQDATVGQVKKTVAEAMPATSPATMAEVAAASEELPRPPAAAVNRPAPQPVGANAAAAVTPAVPKPASGIRQAVPRPRAGAKGGVPALGTIPHPVTAGIVPLPFERDMWQSFHGPEHATRFRRFVTAIFFLACAALTVLVRRIPPGTALPLLQHNFAAVVSVPRQMLDSWLPAPVGEPLTSDQAQTLLSRWQPIKAEALGPKHNPARLSEVLEGKMLREWSDRATSLAADKWHFDYNLKKLDVNSVITTRGGRNARIMTTVKEEVKLHNAAGKVHDQDLATYTIEFRARRIADGSWRLFDSHITGVRR